MKVGECSSEVSSSSEGPQSFQENQYLNQEFMLQSVYSLVWSNTKKKNPIHVKHLR